MFCAHAGGAYPQIATQYRRFLGNADNGRLTPTGYAVSMRKPAGRRQGMDNPYDVHSWSRPCREDALREARKRHLVERAEAERGRRFGQNRVGAARRSALLPLLGGTKPAALGNPMPDDSCRDSTRRDRPNHNGTKIGTSGSLRRDTGRRTVSKRGREGGEDDERKPVRS